MQRHNYLVAEFVEIILISHQPVTVTQIALREADTISDS